MEGQCTHRGSPGLPRGMVSPSEFTTRAARLLNDAVALSKNRRGDKTELNHWMAVAKRQRLTWVDGLAFSIEKMRSASVN
jgi:hypothetical protein